MPPLIILAAAAAGALFGAKALKREWLRVNKELDAADAASVGEGDRRSRPTLRRDPATGEWRPL
jgi:hypothetical protein